MHLAKVQEGFAAGGNGSANCSGLSFLFADLFNKGILHDRYFF